jgi:cytochrome c553
MRTAATAVVNATDVPAAAAGAASLVGTCGDCHAASNVTPTLPPPVILASSDGTKGHMAEHQQAVDQLYRGIVANSDEDWKKGAEALKDAPLGGKDLPQVSKDAVAAEASVHAVAARAATAADRGAKVSAYGEIIGACASCHGIHGKIWGPGVPKTE